MRPLRHREPQTDPAGGGGDGRGGALWAVPVRVEAAEPLPLSQVRLELHGVTRGVEDNVFFPFFAHFDSFRVVQLSQNNILIASSGFSAAGCFYPCILPDSLSGIPCACFLHFLLSSFCLLHWVQRAGASLKTSCQYSLARTVCEVMRSYFSHSCRYFGSSRGGSLHYDA